MIVYLMRHGQAVPKGEAATDAERPLSAEGRTDAYAAAVGFKRLGLPVDLVWTSPLLRAWQTAELLSTVIGVSMEICAALGPEQDVEAIFSELALGLASRRAVLVGHQPGLEQIIASMLGGVAEMPMVLSPLGVVWCELPEFPHSRRGLVRGLFPGELLRRLGQG